MKKKSLKINAILNILRKTMSIVFPLITLPYVSRVLGSSAYGKYSFSLSVVNYFMILAMFGVTNYGVREGAIFRNDREKMSEFASEMFTFNLFTTTISYLLLFVIVCTHSKYNCYFSIIAIQSLSIVLTGIGMEWVNVVFEDYVYITVRYIISQLLCTILIFVFVKDAQDLLKYCFILVIGSYGGNLVNLFHLRKYIDIKLRIGNIVQRVLPLTLLFANSMAVTIYVNSDITMLGFMRSDREVGIYGFSAKIYNILKHAINAGVLVFVPRLGYIIANDKKKYWELVHQIIDTIIILILPISFGMIGLSDTIIYLCGGIEYLEGSLSLNILGIALIFALISSVYSNCILIVNKLDGKCLFATIASASINVVINFAVIRRFGMTGAAATTVVAEFINLLIQMYFTSKCLKDTYVSKSLLHGSVGAICAYAFGQAFTYLFPNQTLLFCTLRIAFSVICTGIVYGMFLFSTKNETFLKLICRIKKE